MAKIDFSHSPSYAATPGGISVPVTLTSGAQSVGVLCYIDTGASNCLFEHGHGRMLNLDIEAGEPMTFQTATGRVRTFGHVVSIEVLGLKFESMVYFFADEEIEKNLLGRGGWLDRVRFGLVEYDRRFYLSAYDFESAAPAV
jgi:hypothetical protein